MLDLSQTKDKIPVKEFFISIHEHKEIDENGARPLLLRDSRDHTIVAWPEGEYTVSMLVSDGKRAIEVTLGYKDFEDMILWMLDTLVVIKTRFLDWIEKRLAKEYKDLMEREKRFETPRIVYNENDVEHELKQYAAILKNVMKLERERDRTDEIIDIALKLKDAIKKTR